MSKHQTLAIVVVFAAILLVWPRPAHAMHIAEGILPFGWAALWFAVAAPFVWWGLRTINRRRADDSRTPTMIAMVGAGVFLVSCMPVPIPLVGTCSHPCGTGLAALLIGPGPTVVVASIALFLQALFLAHGGLTTWGANVVSMGVVGAYAAYGSFRLLRAFRLPLFAAAFVAGAVADWATYAATSLTLSLALCGDGALWPMFAAVLLAFVPTQLPLGIAEGILTAVAYRFVSTRRPELLNTVANSGAVAGVS
jgi:cobalt/nickel transport system permease protein